MIKGTLLWIKSTAVLLLCLFCFPSEAQIESSDQHLTYKRQWRFSISTLVYDNLMISNQGTKHLQSLPTLSGEFTVSYFQHIKKGFGIIIGAGVGITPYNLRYRFMAPDDSPFHFDNGEPFELDLFHNDYDGLYFQVPVSIHKTIPTLRKHDYSIEVGSKLNLQNIDPDFLPYRWEFGSEYEVDSDNVRLFDSYQETNNGILAISYFLKIGLIRPTVNQHTLEYRLVVNWSPAIIRKGEYEFQNLPYTSSGTTEQNINFIGFEFTHGLTKLRRLKGGP